MPSQSASRTCDRCAYEYTDTEPCGCARPDRPPLKRDRGESPTLQGIRDEAAFDPHDGEPTDPERLERYIELLEAHVRAGDMLRGVWNG
jgi:hypothetical protein